MTMNGSAAFGASKNYTDQEVGKILIDFIYPVGSIFITTVKSLPDYFKAGTWELLEEGRVLWTTNGNDGGEFIEAGLPNIKGDLSLTGGGSSGGWISGNGALKEKNTGSKKFWAASSGSTAGVSTGIDLDASKSNGIYGNSDTVQPPAVKVYAYKRVA